MIEFFVVLYLVNLIYWVRHFHIMAVLDSTEKIVDLYVDEQQRQEGKSEELEISMDSWWLWKQTNIKGIL